LRSTPETVSITFEDREFGWLSFDRLAHQREDEPPPGPTLTTMVTEDTPEAWHDAGEAAQRFLSALTFQIDTRMESRTHSGGSGGTALLHPSGALDARDTFGLQFAPAPEGLRMNADPRLRVALALYREGIRAGAERD
jgi:hypothetical protein